MSRRNPTNRHPYPLELANPEVEVEAIFREKLPRTESRRDFILCMVEHQWIEGDRVPRGDRPEARGCENSF